MNTKLIIKLLSVMGYVGLVSAIVVFVMLVGDSWVMALSSTIGTLIGSVLMFAIADILDSLRAIVNNSAQIYKEID